MTQQELEKLNPLQRAAVMQNAFTRMMREQTGYETITTFYGDFTIAEGFGLPAIRQTYEDAKRAWGKNVKYFTELVLVLNHKIWEHYKTKADVAQLYDELWRQADTYALDTFKDEEDAQYYFDVTD